MLPEVRLGAPHDINEDRVAALYRWDGDDRTLIPSSHHVEEDVWVLTPDEPLDALTLYEMNYELCGQLYRSTWRTSAAGPPVDLETTPVVGTAIDLTGAITPDIFGDRGRHLVVSREPENELRFLAAWSEIGEVHQDLCMVTMRSEPGIMVDNPLLAFDGYRLQIDEAFSFSYFGVEADLTPGGYLDGIEFSLEYLADEEASNGPCTNPELHDSFCYRARFDRPTVFPTEAVVARTEQDILDDPACPEVVYW